MRGTAIKNRVAYDILSGKSILSSLLLDLHERGAFHCPFWVKANDLENFLSSPTLNFKHIRLLPSAIPVRAAVTFAGYRWFYNVYHTTDPFALFEYFLYKRHFYGSLSPFHFDTQCKLEEHAESMGFTSRVWITQWILDNFMHSQMYIQPGSVCAPIKAGQLDLFNIMQVNRPKELLHRLQNIPRSILGGKALPCSWWDKLYEYQMENNIFHPLWCRPDQLGLIGLPLKDTARRLCFSLESGSSMESIELINIDDFMDPLAAYRVYAMERTLQRSCVDVFQSLVFSRSDNFRLCEFKKHTGFNSRFWIRPCDAKKVGATCITGQQRCTARCSSGEWYNFNQIHNFRQVLQDINEWKKRHKRMNNAPEPISLLNDIIDNEV